MPSRPEVVSPGEGLESGLDDIVWAEVRVWKVVGFGGFAGFDWEEPMNIRINRGCLDSRAAEGG